ncbi:MAG: hypothetical protein H0Z28_11270 [Archaeoglobus sp.]|nr:hypothetical protein [Archaeoglobus sp.]
MRSRYFESYNKEMERVEKELDEYYVYSLLAIAAKDKEAYEGYQSLMSEKYWPFFFRRIMLETSLYFVLLSPYMLLSNYALAGYVQNAFSWVLFIAIAFFTARVGLRFIKDSIQAWKDHREAERKWFELLESR